MNSVKNKKRILILCPSPKGTAATQRLKYEQYLDQLQQEGYSFTISSFQSQRFWKIIYQPGRTAEKIAWTIAGYFKRTCDLFRIPFYDGIFVNLWVTPIGLPIFERLVLLLNRNVIYDIDDMIFLDQKKSGKENFIQRLKGKKKPLVLMKKAGFVIVCTPSLESIALDLNKYKRVIDISSTLDTDRFLPVPCYKNKDTTVLGWTGTHSTIPFLHLLTPVLQKVSQHRKIKLLVIADRPYQMESIETEFIKWTSENEVTDLHKMDIGLYPIPMNEWSLGKSSLKALTYMSVALPVVTPSYGTNFRVIEDGVDGILVKNEQEWVDSIIGLIDDADKRKRIGLAGRKKVEEKFSIKANYSKYLQVFKTVIPI